MFNKPNFFGQNEPITRRETTSVLGNNRKLAGATSSPPMTPPPQAAAPASAVLPPAAATSSAAGTALALAIAGKEPANSENIIGARLIVGPEVKLKGAEILDCDTLVVEGRVEATMDSRVIRIAEHGSFSGKVSIDIAEIHGCFDGELTARSQLIIHSTGRVSGKIRYGKLLADEGGELCGDINTISAPQDHKPKAALEPVPSLSVATG
jgi:cytoskeletal protein CcmA (bactofilin family)